MVVYHVPTRSRFPGYVIIVFFYLRGESGMAAFTWLGWSAGAGAGAGAGAKKLARSAATFGKVEGQREARS